MNNLDSKVDVSEAVEAIRKITTENVDHPNHYQGADGLEVFEVLEQFAPSPEYLEGFYWSNVVKYVLRFSQKNGVEDLKKAQVYLDKLVDALDSH